MKNGRAMPSLSPLSMFSACRIRAGTRGLETTALPRAASVGASIAPSVAASQTSRSPSTASAASQPNRIASGSPMPSSRAGITSSLQFDALMALASVNSTTTSAPVNTSDTNSG